MALVLNKRIVTKKTEAEMLTLITERFQQISGGAILFEKVVTVENVEIWDIGTMLKSTTEVSLSPITDGFLINADVKYHASWWLLVIALICIGTVSFYGLAVPIALFYFQKKKLGDSIEACFKRIQNEVL